jgi:hypothetical protein
MNICNGQIKEIVTVFYDNAEEYEKHKSYMISIGFNCDKKFNLLNNRLQIVYSKLLESINSNKYIKQEGTN